MFSSYMGVGTQVGEVTRFSGVDILNSAGRLILQC